MKKHFIFVALIAIISISCHQSTAPTPVTGPYLGEVTGRVMPLDVNGDSLRSLLAGTTVGLKGTSFITMTDSTGQWTLKNVPAAIYSIYFAKNGFDTVGQDNFRFSGAGVDFYYDQNVVRMPTDTMVLDYAEIRDTVINGYGYPSIFYSGHISSNKLQSYAMHLTLDSVSNIGGISGAWYVKDGKFSGNVGGALDPTALAWLPLGSIASGRKIYIRAELYPVNGYNDVVGYVTHDYSTIMMVTVP